MIVTEAGVDPKVSAVVYVGARAPDAGEDCTALAKGFPTPRASAGIVWSDDWGQLSEDAFPRDFARDLPADKACVPGLMIIPSLTGSSTASLPESRDDHGGRVALDGAVNRRSA